jgi:prolipoprotein diacylglyceryltransferase
VFAIAWPLRKRLRRPLALMWLVIALFAVGRFAEFFVRSDSDDLALGLETAQWTSLLFLAVAASGAWLTLRRRPAAGAVENQESRERAAADRGAANSRTQPGCR